MERRYRVPGKALLPGRNFPADRVFGLSPGEVQFSRSRNQVASVASSTSVPVAKEDSGYLHDPEVQLMLRAREGDDDAFSQLVKAYQDRLVNIFSHHLQSQEQAEDLAQEVFLRIYRSRHGYVPTARFSTWIFRIANNLASNSRRDRGRKREVAFAGGESSMMGVRPEETIVPEKSALMPTRQLDKIEMQSIVHDALSGLNERQRMAVLLHKFEDMSYQDIGDAMEMTPAAVKSLLSRARENLRQALDAYIQIHKST
jgi:RNA polymerase sigma-70 factor, ECF subfamily